jgi:peptide/nickel transport system substrate-binding protein
MFGVQPYDATRPAPFSDSSVRQAAASCIDRQALAASIPGAQVMDTYVMSGDPLFNEEIVLYPFDAQIAASLLDSAGWMDADANASTPRVNAGGTVLAITYLVPDDPSRTASAEVIKSSLESCGFQVHLQAVSWDQLMASGPEGPLFGRSFDLAQLGWSTFAAPACTLYLSSEIPGPYPEFLKGWGGANASGYQNPDFDAACKQAQLSLPGTEVYQQAQLQAQLVFAQDLPALPLFSYSNFALARPDLCGIEPVAGTTLLWNLEGVNYGPACVK